MDVSCSQITITWYPGDPGDTADPLVLLDDSYHTLGPAPVRRRTEQMVQRGDYVRGDAPDFWPRGNKITTLEWTEVREITDPMEAAEVASALHAGTPDVQGWLKIEYGARATTWKCARAVIRGLEDDHDQRRGLLMLTWRVDCGPISILTGGETPPTVYPDGEVLTEESTPTDRYALLLENAP